MREPVQIFHQSSKEDNLLDYQHIDISQRSRISLAGVEIDNLTRDEAVAVIVDFIKKKERLYHILLLEPLKLVDMLPKKPLHRIAKKASLVLAGAGGFDWASKKFGYELKETISLVGLIMDLIRYAEKQSITVFFLGSKEKIIEKLFFNLVRHFPKIRIVGRHSGELTKERELMVKEAIRKTSPDIVFLGFDYPKQEIWIENNMSYLGNSVVIGTWNTFETLAGKIEKAPDYFHKNQLVWLWDLITKPWRILSLWKAFKFYLIIHWQARKFKKKTNEL